MLYYDKIDVSEEIDFNKTSASNECHICLYWFFLNKGFKFQPYVCNGCHDMLIMNLSDVVILKVQGVDYRCITTGISKSVAVNLLQKTGLKKKNGTL